MISLVLYTGHRNNLPHHSPKPKPILFRWQKALEDRGAQNLDQPRNDSSHHDHGQCLLGGLDVLVHIRVRLQEAKRFAESQVGEDVQSKKLGSTA